MKDGIADRLRAHVERGGGAQIRHGAWDMMLEAADEIERLRAMLRMSKYTGRQKS